MLPRATEAELERSVNIGGMQAFWKLLLWDSSCSQNEQGLWSHQNWGGIFTLPMTSCVAWDSPLHLSDL